MLKLPELAASCVCLCVRDAHVEAKVARREDKRAREASPDVTHLPGGGDPMGGGDGDSFQAAQARYVQRHASGVPRRSAQWPAAQPNVLQRFWHTLLITSQYEVSDVYKIFHICVSCTPAFCSQHTKIARHRKSRHDMCKPLHRQLAAAARRGRFGAARAADNAQRLEEVGAKVPD